MRFCLEPFHALCAGNTGSISCLGVIQSLLFERKLCSMSSFSSLFDNVYMVMEDSRDS